MQNEYGPLTLPSLPVHHAGQRERHRPGEKFQHPMGLSNRTSRTLRSRYAHFALYTSVGVNAQLILSHLLAPVPRYRGAARVVGGLLFDNTAAGFVDAGRVLAVSYVSFYAFLVVSS